MSSGSDNEEECIGSVDIVNDEHKKLVGNLLNLTRKQHVSKASRTEPASRISEFDLVKSAKGVHVHDLANVLTKKGKQYEISKRIKRTQQKSKTIPKPLEVVQTDRIHRSVAYERTQQALDDWDPIVASMRSALHTSFPLQVEKKVKLTNKDFKVDWGYKSDLQKELELVQASDGNRKVEADEEDTFPLSAEEIMEKRREMAKIRAQESYRISKARRQKKIKSKMYHRIQRKEKRKQQLKDFEMLQKTDPEAALAKLEEIERARVEERMSLRHKNTGQWAKSKLIRAKYDKDTRKLLSQQLAISRDILQKGITTNNKNESDSEMECDSSTNPNSLIKVSKVVDDFHKEYQNYLQEVQNKRDNVTIDKIESQVAIIANEEGDSNKDKSDNEEIATAIKEHKKKPKHKEMKLRSGKIVKRIDNFETVIANELLKKSMKEKFNNFETVSNNDIDATFGTLNIELKRKIKDLSEKLTNKKNGSIQNRKSVNAKRKKELKRDADKLELLSIPKQHVRPQIDEKLNETNYGTSNTNKLPTTSINDSAIERNPKIDSHYSEDVDANKLIKLKPTVQLDSEFPDIVNQDENEVGTKQQREIIAEAFQNDDIVANFEKEKQDDIDANKPKDIDLSLPGWGSWGGKNIKVSPRKKKRFLITFEENLQRKDRNKPELIINENADKQIKAHMVSELPFPFRNVRDFEASIRAPIGSTFVPETAFRNLTKPAVSTKLGSIIEPMNAEMLIKKTKF